MGKRELINEMISSIDGGREVAAAYLGLSLTAFNDRMYENKGCKFFTADQLLALQSLSKTAAVAKFFAKEAGCVVVTKPQAELIDSVELHHIALQTQKLRGSVDAAIIESIMNDGSIDEQEEKMILDLHDKHIGNRDFEVKATIAVYKK